MKDLKEKISAILSEAESMSDIAASPPTNIKIDTSIKNQGHLIYMKENIFITTLLLTIIFFLAFKNYSISKQYTALITLKQEAQYVCYLNVYATYKNKSTAAIQTEFKRQWNFYSYKKMSLHQFQQITEYLEQLPEIKQQIKACRK